MNKHQHSVQAGEINALQPSSCHSEEVKSTEQVKSPRITVYMQKPQSKNIESGKSSQKSKSQRAKNRS